MTGSHEVWGSIPHSSTKYFKGLRRYPQPLSFASVHNVSNQTIENFPFSRFLRLFGTPHHS